MRFLKNRSGKGEKNVTVQDGGKTGAKIGVKPAYEHAFAPVFSSAGRRSGGI